MDKHIYDKTDKGRDEIATRKYHIPAKQRSLLVMIDGHRSIEVLMKSFGPLGLTVDNVTELLNDGMIVLVDDGVPDPGPETITPHKAGMSAAARMAARRKAAVERAHLGHEGGEHDHGPDTVTGSDAPATPPGMTDAERHMALQDFYTQTIKSTLGLRGMMLQLKVEKCAGLADFRALRETYLEAVLKAKGREMALSLSGRLDQLLGDNEHA
ncbi:MAG TPA: hypothetical protein VFS95_07020 [Telluria sp.]|jgi:hypothetical protein|nr:hypothetical protein [Telluria sp.]